MPPSALPCARGDRFLGGRLRAARCRRQPVAPVHAYRSHRTDGVMESVVGSTRTRTHLRRSPASSSCRSTPCINSSLPPRNGDLDAASQLLMIPDLINNHLCGSTTNEVTNASTTQLLDARTRTNGAPSCVRSSAFDGLCCRALHQPGTTLGTDRGASRHRVSGARGPVRGRGRKSRHRRARSPVPRWMPSRPSIYISCGTWALIGCELAAPLTTVEALARKCHQRARRRQHDALPEERDRALAARGVQTSVGIDRF